VSLTGLTDIGRGFVDNTDSLTEALGELKAAQEDFSGKGGDFYETMSEAIASDVEIVQTAINQSQGLGMLNSVLGVKQDALDVQTALTTAVDTVTPKLDELNTSATNNLTGMQETSATASDAIVLDAQDIQWEINDTKTSFDDLGLTVDGTVPGMTEDVSCFLQAIADGSEPAIGMLVGLASQFNSLAESAKAISGASQAVQGAGNAPAPGFASGGSPDPGVFIAGEQGPEAIFTNQRLSVLNNATTDRLFTALRGGAMGSGITTTNRSSTINAPIYVSNFAQGQVAANRIVDAMRGYG
jgi:hypothetical protein